MTVQRCDRCGVEIEKSWMNMDSRGTRSAMRTVEITHETSDGISRRIYDLCPTCDERLSEFIVGMGVIARAR